jgi:hypothetical protein
VPDLGALLSAAGIGTGVSDTNTERAAATSNTSASADGLPATVFVLAGVIAACLAFLFLRSRKTAAKLNA